VRAVPRLCECYPGIYLTTEEKARKNLSQGKKNLSQVKKYLSQSTVYILPKHPHITKPTQTHTLQNPHIHISFINVVFSSADNSQSSIVVVKYLWSHSSLPHTAAQRYR